MDHCGPLLAKVVHYSHSNDHLPNLHRWVSQTLYRSVTVIYRKIYEEHYGKIPEGFHIHHKDGNHSNNAVENLVAVSVQEHYDIHYKQGDYAACKLLLDQHLSLSKEERFEVRSLASKQISARLLQEGRHNFQNNHPVRKMIETNTHHFQDSSFQSIQGKKSALKRFEKGEHPFQTRTQNPNEIEVECPVCGAKGAKPGMKRWHFENCKKGK